ncbi:MAG: hypothetical protein HC850_02315 [Rhodomicrobium sp.]|nr:hypothetical protein [Rhodomicrobium sp.]
MLDDALQNAMADIPNCIAIGVVDLASGTMLAIQSEEDRSQELLNLMTSAVTELFEAPLLQAFAGIYAESSEETTVAGRQFTELLLLNEYHNYMLIRGRKRTQFAVIVITKKETPVGLVIMKSLAVMQNIENAI